MTLESIALGAQSRVEYGRRGLLAGSSKRFVLRRSSLASAAFAGVVLLAAVNAAHAATMTFTDIADKASQGFTQFSTFPTINNAGAVAFEANRTGFGQGVFRSARARCLVQSSRRCRLARSGRLQRRSGPAARDASAGSP